MADYDASTDKPIYTEMHTRGYYVAGECGVPTAPSVSTLFKNAIPSQTYAEKIKQRAVVSFTPNASRTVTFYYLVLADLASNARNVYHYEGWRILIQLPNSNVSEISYFRNKGKYDVTCHNGVCELEYTGTEKIARRAYYNEFSDLSKYSCYGFVCRPNIPADARYHMGCAYHENSLIQLIYPLATAQNRLRQTVGDFSQGNTAIELMNKQIVEI